MEEKQLTEQESLELISRMIKQTKKDTGIGSGDNLLYKGYIAAGFSFLCTWRNFMPTDGIWLWVYYALFVLFIVFIGFLGKWLLKKHSGTFSYYAKCINNIWKCLAGVFAAYALVCAFHIYEKAGWAGLLLLAYVLPGIGTYCTGVILKEKFLQGCGVAGVMTGLFFLHNFCINGIEAIESDWPLGLLLIAIVTLIGPGHYLNYKSKEQNR